MNLPDPLGEPRVLESTSLLLADAEHRTNDLQPPYCGNV